jgi:hypothetical protein
VKKQLAFSVAVLVLITLLFPSCKDKKYTDPMPEVKGHYFSIKEFGLDQWNTYSGEPIFIVKTVRTEKRLDSSYTNSDTLNWGNIFRIFFETDIGDRKFLGKYDFSQFVDSMEGTRNFYYKALDEDLFTQKLLITINMTNNKIKGIYIQTQKKTIFEESMQKLYYNPMKTIQIQTEVKPLFGAKNYTVVQYDLIR